MERFGLPLEPRIDRLIAIAGVVFGLAGCVTHGYAPLKNAELLRLAPNVTAGRLSNGLQFFVIGDSNASCLALGVEAGELHEKDGESGVAHLVSRLIIASEPELDPNEHEPNEWVHDDITNISVCGIRDLNVELKRARGWIDRELSAEAFAHLSVSKPEDLYSDDLVRFSGTRLLRHPWRGTAEDLKHLDVDELRRFRRLWFVPSRMTLVVHGAWNRDEVAAAIDQTFSSIPARPSPAEPVLFESAREIVAARGCCSLLVSMVVDAPPPRTVSDVHAAIARDLFLRALARRMRDATSLWGDDDMQALEEDERNLTRRYRSYELNFATRVDKTVVIARVTRELERVRLYGFTSDELMRVRAEDEHPSDWAGNSWPDDRCDRPVERAEYGFLPISCDSERSLRRMLLRDMRDDEINALRSIADPRKLAIGAIDPPEVLPTVAALRAARDAALAGHIERWSQLPPLMATKPHPGQVVRVEQRPDGVEYALSNGARLVVHRTSGARVDLRASSPGGAMAASPEDLATMAEVAPIVSVAGLGAHDGVMTHRLLQHHGIELTARIDLRHEDVRGSAPPENVEELFQAVHLAMTADRVDAYSTGELYDSKGDEISSQVAARLPLPLVFDLGYETKRAPALERAAPLYRARFGNAGDFVFELTGPVEPDRARVLVETYIASLPDDGRRERPLPLQKVTKTVEVVQKIPSDQVCVTELSWTSDTPPSRGSLDDVRLWATVVGEFAELGARADQRDDLGYAVHVSAFVECDNPILSERGMRQRLADLAAHSYSGDDVERVRKAYVWPPTATTAADERAASTITAGDIARVLARFAAPRDVIVVRMTH